MNQQKLNHIYAQSLQLAKMVSEMTKDDKLKCASIIKECDISRILSNRTINHELKTVAAKHKGKVKRFLNALGSNPHANRGVDILFQSWSGKL